MEWFLVELHEKLICMNIVQVAVIFSTITAQKKGGTIPVALDTIVNTDKYVNPIPMVNANSNRCKFRVLLVLDLRC